MTESTNYGFNIPEAEDTFDPLAQTVPNWSKIDTDLYAVSQTASAAAQSAASAQSAANNAKNAADSAQSTASLAQTDAADALSSASSAQADATSALNKFSNLTWGNITPSKEA